MPGESTMTRRTMLAGMAAVGVAGQARPLAETGVARVPLDHARPAGEHFDLGFASLSPFDPRRPTVLVVADGQQFYVTPTAFAPSVAPLFDDRCNVVGVFGRADAPAVQAWVGRGSTIDWMAAHRLLRAEQWIGDLDAVRRRLVGPRGKVMLYGRSGGALLAHQYMAAHGDLVDCVFTQAAVNPFLQAELRLLSDRFWFELTDADRARLGGVLARGHYARDRIARLFQRQNFFVARDMLPPARTALIAALDAADDEAVAAREREYQIDALAALRAGPRGPAINVRLFEFFAPDAARFRIDPRILNPDRETSAETAEPLMRLLRAGAINPPTMDFGALHRLDAEVLGVAGRRDHTCDYRTQIALMRCYPRGRLLLLDDDHVFHRLQAAGGPAALIRSFFGPGDASRYAPALAALEPLRWSEG